MKLAYLVNQYPKVSHTFIRREIAAIEQLGIEVERVSIRPTREILENHADEAEKVKTRVLLDTLGGIAEEFARFAVTKPLRLWKAARLAVQVGRRSERGLLRHAVYLAEACSLARWVEQTGCVHVHAHFGTNSATVAMLCRELGGPPFSFTVHGPEEFDKPALISLGTKIGRSVFVAAVSNFGLSQLYRQSTSSDWPKLHVVRCGLDDEFLDAPTVPVPTAPRLVCVGRLCEQKGQVLLIEAARKLDERGVDFELVFVGDGPLRGAVEAAVASFGLGDKVRITGWAGSQQVRDEILAARALVLPSFAEGLPVVLMEAFALGRPVISTYVAGIPELVAPESGWLVPAGDADALTDAMFECLTAAPSTLDAMAAVGARRVRELHRASTSAVALSSLMRGTAA